VFRGIVKFTIPLLVPQVTRHLLDNVFLNEMLPQPQKLRELLLWAGGMVALFVFVYANAMAALDRIYEVMDEEPEIVSAPDPVDLPQIRGEVEFDRVSFSYDRTCPVLREVSFHVEPGERVALVGPSGSGKTTIVSRTTFIIAHRLSTAVSADRILVLSAGRVVESGTHHELLANGGLYRDFHRKQFASAETN
jgi:ABC-type multidrug transport system fused ATPase/permease subunit